MKTCVVAIAKNENKYLREWVEHYLNLKFNKIFLIDNNDIESFNEVIEDYINSGFVEVINKRNVSGSYKDILAIQRNSYNEIYQIYKNMFDWFLFVDIDEFLDLYNVHDVNIFLANPIYNNYNSIAINWEMYDDNDLIEVIDNNYSISRFTRPVALFRVNKKFIRGNLENIIINSAHGALTDEKHSNYLLNSSVIKCCNCVGEPVSSEIRIPVNISLAKIRHYKYKTLQEFIDIRLKKWAGTDYNDLSNFFKNINKLTKEKENYIYKKLNINKMELQAIMDKNKNL